MVRRISNVLFVVAVGCQATIDDPDTIDAPSRDAGPNASTTRDAGSRDAGVEPGQTDAGTVDGGSGADRDGGVAATRDGGTPPAGQVPAFVAMGHMGRTAVSCDDGQSWVYDRSYDLEGAPEVCGVAGPITCFSGTACDFMRGEMCETSPSCDCDHHPGAGNGIAYGDGAFVATWGWGPPGSVRRSTDGINWTNVVDGTTYGGVAFGQGHFVVGDRSPRVSDDGTTWIDGGDADLQAPNGSAVWNVRRIGFADVDGGRFLIAGESGDNRDLLISRDAGETWERPTTLPASCASGVSNSGGIAGGNGTILVLGRTGAYCRSSDGGDTFVEGDLGSEVRGQLVFDGTHFVTWSRGTVHRSTDAVTWTSAPTSPANLDLGPVAHHASTGTFVAVRGGWQRWYADQEFYRSTDGTNWETLAPGTFTGGHPMRFIAAGWVDVSTECPAR